MLSRRDRSVSNGGNGAADGPGLSHAEAGQLERERRDRVRAGPVRDDGAASAVCLRDRVDDCEAEPDAALRSSAGCIGPAEPKRGTMPDETNSDPRVPVKDREKQARLGANGFRNTMLT